MVRAPEQGTFPEIPLAARKRCWTSAGQSCLKLIPVYTFGQKALSHAAGVLSQPIGMEVQRDSKPVAKLSSSASDAQASDPKHAVRATRSAGRAMRSRLLDGASVLFRARGLAGTSISDIAAAANAFPSQITYYFRTKEALFVEAACRDMLYVARAAEQAALLARSPQNYTRALVESVTATDSIAFFAEALSLTRRRQDLAPLVERTIERLHSEGLRAYAGQIERHGWSTLRDPDATSRRFWAVAIGVTVEGYAMGRSPDELCGEMLRVLGEQATTRPKIESARLRGPSTVMPMTRPFKSTSAPPSAAGLRKANGGTRPLGIPTVADRIAQEVVRRYLEPLLEPRFHADSYGYRSGRSAIDAIRTARQRCWRANWVVDLDIQGFFDSIDHGLLLKALRKHTDCRWVLLYVERWLKVPMQLEDGRMEPRTTGTPQGGVVSPLLANLFLHYVFDRWVRQWRRRHARGDMIDVRFADDFIVGFQHEGDAKQFLHELRSRFACKNIAVKSRHHSPCLTVSAVLPAHNKSLSCNSPRK